MFSRWRLFAIFDFLKFEILMVGSLERVKTCHYAKFREKWYNDSHTTTVLRPFVRDYPGEPVPEKNTHPPTFLIIIQSLSASSIYHDP